LLRLFWHRWSLSRVFENERHDGMTHLFGKEGLSDFIDLPRSELAAALIASEGVTSSANASSRNSLPLSKVTLATAHADRTPHSSVRHCSSHSVQFKA
jgi:hypothetical protein